MPAGAIPLATGAWAPGLELTPGASMRARSHYDLEHLLARVQGATDPDATLVGEVLRLVCPRRAASLGQVGPIQPLVQAGAWVDLALALIDCEFPDWSLHRLSCDEGAWACALARRGLAVNWSDDVALFEHEHMALALFGALVRAQLNKAQGLTPRDVLPFARPSTASASL